MIICSMLTIISEAHSNVSVVFGHHHFQYLQIVSFINLNTSAVLPSSLYNKLANNQ